MDSTVVPRVDVQLRDTNRSCLYSSGVPVPEPPSCVGLEQYVWCAHSMPISFNGGFTGLVLAVKGKLLEARASSPVVSGEAQDRAQCPAECFC